MTPSRRDPLCFGGSVLCSSGQSMITWKDEMAQAINHEMTAHSMNSMQFWRKMLDSPLAYVTHSCSFPRILNRPTSNVPDFARAEWWTEWWSESSWEKQRDGRRWALKNKWNNANNHTLFVSHLQICDIMLLSDLRTSAADDSPICSWEVRQGVGWMRYYNGNIIFIN